MDYQKLFKEAKGNSKLSYSPYSKYAVGAALLTKKGKYYAGANIENASYPLSMCAERTAIYNALLYKEDPKNFVALAIYVNDDKFPYPCGACRQVIEEFCPKDMLIVVFNKDGKHEEYLKKDLFPHAFVKENL